MQEKIIIETNIQESDYKRMMRFILWDSPEKEQYRTKTITIKTLSFSVGFLLSGVLIYLFSEEVSSMFSIIYVIVIILFAAGYASNGKESIGDSIEQKAITFIQLPENKNTLGKQHFEISLEKIFIQTNNISATYDWESIIKVVFTDSDYYLYINSVNAVLIPTNSFSTKDDILKFEKLIRLKTFVVDYKNVIS
jgi:hypothetical protein